MMETVNVQTWDEFLARAPEAHLLQTSGWGELKSTFSWQAGRVIWRDASLEIGAQILFRRVLPGLSMAYLPKGPVIIQNAENAAPMPLDAPALQPFWAQVDDFCRQNGAFCLKLEPDAWQECIPLEGEEPIQHLPVTTPRGFVRSQHAIQPPRTIAIDLQGSEEQILARMKQKTRYNIRLAQRKGVTVRPTSDLGAFYNLMTQTGARDGFGVHSQEYFSAAYRIFHPAGQAELLTAEYEGTALAALMVFRRGRRAWYLYGASSNEQRELMPTYLLQWEAMRWARQQGCSEYDLWGVPDASLAELEANFTNPEKTAAGLWGVYRFKRGFGGALCRAAGPYDRVYNRLAYAFYLWRVGRSQGD